MSGNPLERFFGGPPVRTILWLAFLSVVIGFVLVTIGLDPLTLIHRVVRGLDNLVNFVVHLGLDSFDWLGRYLLYGAVIVVPVWLISRLMSFTRRS